MTPSVVRVLAVGLLAGFTAGLFGVGGGIVIVPGLVVFAGFAQRLAHGVSLAAIVVIGASGTIGYATAGEVDWPVAAAMTVGGLGGAVVGTWLLRIVPQDRLRLAFAALLVLAAVRMVIDTPVGAARGDLTVASVAGYVALGVAAGVLAGLMGVGGGILTVPALTIVVGFPLVIAKGTSLAVIVPTALSGTVRNLRHGNTDIRAAAMIGVAGVVSAFAASKLSLGLDADVSAVLFAGLLVVSAGRMVVSSRRGEAEAEHAAVD